MVFDCSFHAVESRLHSRDFYAHEVGTICADFWNTNTAVSTSSFDVLNGNRVGLRVVDAGCLHG